jgi:hypothetical protein
MSLEKAIKHNKEKRKQYVGKDYCKLVDPACRNHGGCPYCEENRLHKDNVSKEKQKEKIKEYFKGSDSNE